MGKRLKNCLQPRQITADAEEGKDYRVPQRYEGKSVKEQGDEFVALPGTPFKSK